MKNKLFLATAIIALAACSENTYLGDENGVNGSGGAISFGFDVPSATRADGATAAGHLGNQFVVWGEKSETTDGAAAADGKLVFKNYIVNYVSNSAYTTTSNIKNWEYVGFKLNEDGATIPTTNYSTNITPNSGTGAQTIKYWDYSADNYVFTAVSALNDDIKTGRVKITKKQAATTGNKIYDKGYTITLAKTTGSPDVYPSLNKLYFSDRVEIEKGTGTNREDVNKYGGNVQLTFRNLVSQIRAGVYETVPGYDITKITFYVNTEGSSPTQTLEAKVSETPAFGAVCPNTAASNYEGNITVVYYNEGDVKNQPKVTASGEPNTNLILGTNMNSLSTSNLLGKVASTPTWDKSDGDFTEVIPQINNNQNLKLKVDYTLWNSESGETINKTGKTAEIPAQYLQWKPNYKYSYLFKITDDDLYPITFDAVEIVAADGQAEYITTVSEPSITTFGVKDDKYSVGKNEYETGTTVYMTFVNTDGTVFNPTLGSNVHIYNVTSDNETTFPITEASVAEAMEHPSGNKIHCTHECCGHNNAEKVTSVPAEDGTTININAVKFTPNTAKTYAIQWITTAPTISSYGDGTVLDAGTSLSGYYRHKYTKCTSGTADPATIHYYKQTTVKVGKVLDAGTSLNGFFTDAACATPCAENTVADGSSTYYKPVTAYIYNSEDQPTNGSAFDENSLYYTEDAAGYEACGDDELANGVMKYFTPTYSSTGKYVYKIIRIVAP